MKNLNYDSEFDILRICFDDAKSSCGCEEYDGLVVFRSNASRAISSFMIYDFLYRYKNNQLPVFPDAIVIDVERDVLPKITLPN